MTELPVLANACKPVLSNACKLANKIVGNKISHVYLYLRIASIDKCMKAVEWPKIRTPYYGVLILGHSTAFMHSIHVGNKECMLAPTCSPTVCNHYATKTL